MELIMNPIYKSEKVIGVIKSKYSKTLLLAGLIIGHYLLAGIPVSFSFIMIIFIFSYLAAAGILFKKPNPEKFGYKKWPKLYKASIVFWVLQRIFAWVCLAILIVAFFAQLYAKIIF